MATKSRELAERPVKFNVLEEIGTRLVSAQTPQEIVLWTQVRGEVSRQEEDSADRRLRRTVEKTQLIGKIILSIVAMSIGFGLIYIGFAFAGLFALGAGLFWLAPDFVTSFFNKVKAEGWNENE